MDEGNVYNITHVEEIKPDVEAEVNERIKKSDNGLLVNNSEYGQRNIDRDTKSSRYRGTSESVSELFETESEQPRGNGSKQVNKNSTKNIRKELDNSSFSLNEKAPIKENQYAGRFADGTSEQLQRAKNNLENSISRLEKTVNAQEEGTKIDPNAFEKKVKFKKDVEINIKKRKYML